MTDQRKTHPCDRCPYADWQDGLVMCPFGMCLREALDGANKTL